MGRYNLKICCVKAGDKKIIIKNFSFVIEKVNNVAALHRTLFATAFK